jgi:hypothetical protein
MTNLSGNQPTSSTCGPVISSKFSYLMDILDIYIHVHMNEEWNVFGHKKESRFI